MLNLLLEVTLGSLTSTLKYFLSALYNTAVRHQGKLSEKPWSLLTPHYKSEYYHTEFKKQVTASAYQSNTFTPPKSKKESLFSLSKYTHLQLFAQNAYKAFPEE